MNKTVFQHIQPSFPSGHRIIRKLWKTGLYLLIPVLFCIGLLPTKAQPVPAEDENIPYLVTFGKASDPEWGDDDFCQIFFCAIPRERTAPFFIRVYDPDVSGELDESKGSFDTEVSFQIYGGKGCWSHKDAKATQPEGNFKSGIELDSRTFSNDASFDQKWYTFGPFNPQEGELVPELGGRIFKIIAQGISGDDGNLYRYFVSESPSENIAVEGNNLFTYEYTFRLSDAKDHISQVYPYIDDQTISIKVSNFDWDDDGLIKVYSVVKNGLPCAVSRQGTWTQQEFPIRDEEKNTSLEIQFVKNQWKNIMSNNVCITVQNQYGQSLPFFVIPIGGAPVYVPRIMMRSAD